MAAHGFHKLLSKRWLTAQFQRMVERGGGRLYHDDLVKLATIFKTDKGNEHRYLQHYARYFAPLRLKPLNILEIGVGGYADPTVGGNSLRMWKAYFPNSRIYGIDIAEKTAVQEERITVFQGRQEDPAFFRRVVTEDIGRLDVVIDDGSHVCGHVITAFDTLFPLLHEDGIYVIEDTQASYWPGFGGGSDELNDPKTTMGYFKTLVDGLNHAEYLRPGYRPTYCDRHIVAIHFYHNLIFIFKGDNMEGSNIIRHNTTDAAWILKAEWR